MFDIFEKNRRREIRENFLNKLDNYSRILHNDIYIRGLLVCIFHIIIVTIPFLLIIYSNNIKYIVVSQLILLLILFQHFYFDGCWMIRLERKIWNTKEWYGLWTYLFNILEYLGITLNRNRRDNIFYIVYAGILLFGFYRIFTLKKVF